MSSLSFQHDRSSKINPTQKQMLQMKACTTEENDNAMHIDAACIFIAYIYIYLLMIKCSSLNSFTTSSWQSDMTLQGRRMKKQCTNVHKNTLLVTVAFFQF